MLSKIRKFAHSFIVKVLLVFILISMTFWGVSSKTGGNYVAKVDGKEIPIDEFLLAKKSLITHMRSQYPNSPLDDSHLNQLTMYNQIQSKLFELKAKELGLYVSTEVIIDNIKNNRMFHDASGNFDKELFKRFLAHYNLSEERYVEDVKHSINSDDIIALLPKYNPSDKLINEIYKYNRQKRLADIVTIKYSHQAQPISDKQIHEYYSANQKEFMVQEYRDVEYIIIRPEQFKSYVKISDADLENAINEIGLKSEDAKNSKEIEQIKTRLFDQKAQEIMYEKIKEIEDNLSAGDSVKDITSKYDKVEYYSISRIDENGNILSGQKDNKLKQYYDKVLKVIFELSENRPSDTIALSDSKSEYCIITVKKIYPAHSKDIALVRENIKSRLALQQKESVAKQRSSELYAKFSSSQKHELPASEVMVKKIVLSRPDYEVTSKSDQGVLERINIAQVFDLKNVGDYTHLFKTRSGEFAFAILQEIQETRLSPTDKETALIASELSKHFNSMIYQEFFNSLYKEYNVQINEPVLQRLSRA